MRGDERKCDSVGNGQKKASDRLLTVSSGLAVLLTIHVFFHFENFLLLKADDSKIIHGKYNLLNIISTRMIHQKID